MVISTEIEEIILKEKANISVVLKNLTTNEMIYKYNELKQVPSASIIKIVVMIEAMNQVMKGRFKLDQMINIEDQDKVEYSIITELQINQFTFEDLITLMIIVSDNTATNLLIDLLGEENINRFARELDLENTILQRKMMDFEAARRGKQNYTSPFDMSRLLDMIYRKEILSHDMCDFMMNILKKQKDREMIPKYLSGNVVAAHKTGELENLNHDIGIIFLDEIDYSLGVFVTDAKSNLEAKEIVANISKIVYKYFIDQGVHK